MNIKIADIDIHYEKFGDETLPAALFMHGWGADISLYKRLLETIGNKYCVYAADFPGCGMSGQLQTPWTLDDYAEFILSFIGRLNITPVLMIGHSHGGRCALKLAGEGFLNPQKIILLDSAGVVNKPKLKKRLRRVTYKTVKNVLSLPLIRKFSRNLLDKARSHFGSADYKNANPVMRQTLVSLVNTDLRLLFPKIKASTLLIWGENDTDTPLSDGKLMESLIPDA